MMRKNPYILKRQKKMTNNNDVEIIKKIILKLYNIDGKKVIRNDLYFLDNELIELLRELGEK